MVKLFWRAALVPCAVNTQRVSHAVNEPGKPGSTPPNWRGNCRAQHLARGADLSAQHRLLTNDALTLAVMEKRGVTALATNDDDFDTVEGITVYKPTRT